MNKSNKSDTAAQLQGIVSGIGESIKDLGHLMAENDQLVTILLSWLQQKGIDTVGFSMRHFDRNGQLEFLLRSHSSKQGVSQDTLYYASRSDLKRWAEKDSVNTVSSRPTIRIK